MERDLPCITSMKCLPLALAALLLGAPIAAQAQPLHYIGNGVYASTTKQSCYKQHEDLKHYYQQSKRNGANLWHSMRASWLSSRSRCNDYPNQVHQPSPAQLKAQQQRQAACSAQFAAVDLSKPLNVSISC